MVSAGLPTPRLSSLAPRQLTLALMLLQGRLVGLSAVSCRSPAAVFSAGLAVGVKPPGPVSALQWGSAAAW